MKRKSNLFLLLGFLLIVVVNCENSPTDSEGANKVTLSGQVINIETQKPMEGVVVRVQNISPEPTIITDAEGKYHIEFEIENTIEVLVIAFKENFLPDTTSILVVPDRTMDLPLLRLTPISIIQ